ncbi:MAG: hypothetical protein J5930_11975 [Treponema sp.]|nr:hypothetical protein [Treponema sp.]
MKTKNAMQLKALIKNKSKEVNISLGIAIAMGKVPEEISVCKRHNISRNCKCCKRGNS